MNRRKLLNKLAKEREEEGRRQQRASEELREAATDACDQKLDDGENAADADQQSQNSQRLMADVC